MNQTIFLKLGGSLITDKDNPQTALLPQIDQIALQIRQFVKQHPEVRLLLGHGSGSFGHSVASRFQTRNGVQTADEWVGFSQVWYSAHLLNQIVSERLVSFDLPVVSLPLSAAGMTRQKQLQSWNTDPIKSSLDHHLIPIIFGDVIFDQTLGGTILSTEEQFSALVPVLHPDLILLAGLEAGVWEDFPKCTRLMDTITPMTYPIIADKIFGSASVDVTGGMSAKVKDMLSLIEQNDSLRVRIFSGKEPNAIRSALEGEPIGTLLKSDL